MELRGIKRVVSVVVVTGALLLGAWAVPAGAAQDTLPAYSDEDCTTLLDVQVDDPRVATGARPRSTLPKPSRARPGTSRASSSGSR